MLTVNEFIQWHIQEGGVIVTLPALPNMFLELILVETYSIIYCDDVINIIYKYLELIGNCVEKSDNNR